MAHYAMLNADGIVTSVIVGKDEGGEVDWESYYGSRHGCECRRTSYNTRGGVHRGGGEPFRKNFASPGYTYDSTRDAFIPPKPFPSWALNEQSCLWESPVPPPVGVLRRWDEATQSWVELGK